MKRVTWAILFAVSLLLVIPQTSEAGRTRVFIGANIGVGHPGWWGHPARWHHHGWGPRYYWNGPVVVGPWPPYAYYEPPPVIVQRPPVYVEPEAAPEDYWYYCQNPQGYYPYIKTCPGGWLKVVPDVTPPDR